MYMKGWTLLCTPLPHDIFTQKFLCRTRRRGINISDVMGASLLNVLVRAETSNAAFSTHICLLDCGVLLLKSLDAFRKRKILNKFCCLQYFRLRASVQLRQTLIDWVNQSFSSYDSMNLDQYQSTISGVETVSLLHTLYSV